MISFEDTESFPAHLRGLGIPIEVGDIRLVSNSSIVIWEVVRCGMGVSVMLKEIAYRTPDVAQILPDLPPFEVPLWLVTHRELRTSRRIRRAFDILSEKLTLDIIGTTQALRRHLTKNGRHFTKWTGKWPLRTLPSVSA